MAAGTGKETRLTPVRGPRCSRSGPTSRTSASPAGGNARRLSHRRPAVRRSACGPRSADSGPQERHLIHSDLLNFNVLVADDLISAVIDWGSSLYGDFSTTSPGSSSGHPGSRPGVTSISDARPRVTTRRSVSPCRVSRSGCRLPDPHRFGRHRPTTRSRSAGTRSKRRRGARWKWQARIGDTRRPARACS